MTANTYNSLQMVIKVSESKGELPIKAEVRPLGVVANVIHMGFFVRVLIWDTAEIINSDLLVISVAIDLKSVSQLHRGLRECQAF